MFKITKGLDIPISGDPNQKIHEAKRVKKCGIVCFDYHGMKPTILVNVGDKVSLGQPIIRDKKDEQIAITSPVSGIITEINRGEKRVLQSIVIDCDSADNNNQIEFNRYSENDLSTLEPHNIREQLLISGLWAAFRTRPFSKIPSSSSSPESIFINCMDTNPLSGDPEIIIAEYQTAFSFGLDLISKLAPIHICKSPELNLSIKTSDNINTHTFAGPHPAGLTGTHIHFISPVSANKTVWTINYQDVIAIGKLFSEGKIWNQRVISLAGPVVKNPRLIHVTLGADINELTESEFIDMSSDIRTISGPILAGRTAKGAFAYLGRYHLQVSCIAEASKPELFDYIRPTGERFSALNLFFSKLFKRKLNLTTNTEGEPRNMVPFGNYELVMPLDILPTQLLRALIIGDTEMAQELGCLELDEEDLALCSYVCAGKYEYGPILRAQLARIEVEG